MAFKDMQCFEESKENFTTDENVSIAIEKHWAFELQKMLRLSPVQPQRIWRRGPGWGGQRRYVSDFFFQQGAR